jgi:hypothetical protein
MTNDEWRSLKDDIARINRERRRRIQAQRVREYVLRALDATSITRPFLDSTRPVSK